MSRNLYLNRIKQDQQARAQVRELHPSTEFLFGGKVGELCKHLKDSAELNPLASYGGGYSKRGRGSFVGYNQAGYQGYQGGYNQGFNSSGRRIGRGGARRPGRGPRGNGLARGDRLGKFKD